MAACLERLQQGEQLHQASCNVAVHLKVALTPVPPLGNLTQCLGNQGVVAACAWIDDATDLPKAQGSSLFSIT